MEQYGRNRLQYPRTPEAEVARMRAIERLRQLTQDRDRYLDQAQECSDAIRRIKDEHNITVESREPIQDRSDWSVEDRATKARAEDARDIYRRELHEALDRGMDKGPVMDAMKDGINDALDRGMVKETIRSQLVEIGVGSVTAAEVAERIDGILLEDRPEDPPMPDRPGDDSPLPDEDEEDLKGIGPGAGGLPTYHSLGGPFDPDAWGHHA